MKSKRHGRGTSEESGPIIPLSDQPVDHAIWGLPGLDETTLKQLDVACRLPVAVRAAQMPDGHVGYGLPIGGVLAVRDAVIPYAVGVDIACRMKLSIVAERAGRLAGWRDKLKKALVSETRFGVGAQFQKGHYREHDMLEDPLWDSVDANVRALFDKARAQLGTSGSGNHFVEWGELEVRDASLGVEPGAYLALLSHSGSRGFGAAIADFYSKLAMEKTPLEGAARHLAWLSLRSDAGRAYWNAMTLAGKYASANHDLVHRHVLKAAGLDAAVQIENHHNFAWKETHYGEDVVVHRKGATPAGAGVLGVIPGSMGDPGYVVRGKGNGPSLHSAAHGAGRRMSRKAATQSITRSAQLKYLAERGVELIAGGIDEAPMAYKNIDEVMAAQADLVEIHAAFHPRIVLMAADGTAED